MQNKDLDKQLFHDFIKLIVITPHGF